MEDQKKSWIRLSCYSEYSPAYAGGIVFFGAHTDRVKACRYPEGNPITDSELFRLRRLTNLKGVELGTGSKITEDGIETLCELTELAHLSLGDVVISSSILQKLQKLKNLKWLELVDTKLSANDLDSFRLALPVCDVKVLPPTSRSSDF